MRVDHRHARPARFVVDPLECVMLPIVGQCGDRRLALLGELGDERRRRGDPVADQQDQSARLEPADRFMDIADREDADPVEAQALDRILKRLGHALDDHHDRRGAGGRGTARLIFEQASTGERKQRAMAARTVFLVRPDDRAERHSPAFPPRPDPNPL